MWHDISTASEVFRKYDISPPSPKNPLSKLSTKERAHIRAEVEGTDVKRYGFRKDSSILNRPRVVAALEDILEESGLSDKRLARRMKEIIFDGKGANADNTAHNAIRTVWQLKGKFAAEKHEMLVRSEMANLSNEQLDKIIDAGMKELRITQVKIGSDPGTPLIGR